MSQAGHRGFLFSRAIATTRKQQAIVTLNLFQGPFLGDSGACVFEQAVRTGVLPAAFERAARWTLKRVQGDENGKGLVNVKALHNERGS